MEILILILKIIFGVFFMYAGYMHFKKPKFFNGFIPDFLPKLAVNYIFGIIEFFLGLGLFFNQTIKNAALGIFILLLLFLPKLAVNYIFGIIEFFLGLGLFFNQTIKNAALGIFILLLLFLPIHIWDLLKEKPAIGSKKLAIIRIPLQFLLMYCAYLIYMNS